MVKMADVERKVFGLEKREVLDEGKRKVSISSGAANHLSFSRFVTT